MQDRHLLFLLAAAATALGCSGEPPSSSASAASAGTDVDGSTLALPSTPGPEIGAVGLALTFPGGESFSSLSYTLTNGTNTYAGSYSIASASTLSFVIASVAAGDRYSIALTATSDDGKDTCSFPAPGAPLTGDIQVLSRTTTVVDVAMQCLNQPGLDAGSVLVRAVESLCPLWNFVAANPVDVAADGGANVADAETAGSNNAFNPAQSVAALIRDGQQALVIGSGTGPDPGSLAFTWSIVNPDGNGEHLDTVAANASTAGTTQGTGQNPIHQVVFSCPPASPPQTYTVQMVVTDGPVPDGGSCDPRFATGTVQITCQP